MIPFFITETNERFWNDCTICSGLMAANKVKGNIYPATLAEREALRRATGDTVGGVGIDALNRGLRRRYGFELDAPYGQRWGNVRTFLRDKGGALIQGNYRYLGEPWIRWDRNFASRRVAAHALYADHYLASTDKVFIMDPLGRGTNSRTGERYAGEYVPASDVRSFMEHLQYHDGYIFVAYAPSPKKVEAPHVVVKPPVILVPKEPLVKFVSTNGYGNTSKFLLDVKAGTPVWYFDGTLMTKVSKDATVEVFGSADAHTGNWIVEVSTGGPYFDQDPRSTFGIIKSGSTPREKP